MQRIEVFLLVALALSPHCNSCILKQTLHDETRGLLSRCLNTTGTNEWHIDIACWVRPLGSAKGVIRELRVGENYSLTDGRIVAECRNRFNSGVTLVYKACLNATRTGIIKWPGDVWTGMDGLQYTCTNASLSSSSYYRQSSRVILFACDSSSSSRLVVPGAMEVHTVDGIVSRCEFSGTEVDSMHIRYFLKPIGCGFYGRPNTSELVKLGVDEEYYLPTTQDQAKTLFAVCKQKYGKLSLVYLLCRRGSGNALYQPGEIWNVTGGVTFTCIPAKPSELTSAKAIPYGCYLNSTLFPPGSDSRMADGTVTRCIIRESDSGWYKYVGCWFKYPANSKLNNSNISAYLRPGEQFCPDGKTCLAACVLPRYGDKVALVSKVCFDSVGSGPVYRQPHENWTDSSGVSRTCLPMPDQRDNFGVSAKTILNGCPSEDGLTTTPPGSLIYATRMHVDFIVRECAFDKYYRKYNALYLNPGRCWMLDYNGGRVTMEIGHSYILPSGKEVATCRKNGYKLAFTLNVCFKSKAIFAKRLSTRTTPLSWNISDAAFPGEKLTNGSIFLECYQASKYFPATWIVYGCQSTSGTVAPGTTQLFGDNTIRNCSYNKMDSRPAYEWGSSVGCWFLDHLNQIISITQFNIIYNHSKIGKPTATCQFNGYSAPKLRMLLCFSAVNKAFYTQGEDWTDSVTGLPKLCARLSQNPSDGVTTVDAGCWLQEPSSNSTTASRSHYVAKNGSFVYGSENRVLRCDFNERRNKFEWLTSVACWHNSANGTPSVLAIGQVFSHRGMFLYKCVNTQHGAKMVQYACEHNGTWHNPMSTWKDSNFMYKCIPASGEKSAQAEKTHCVTDDGTPIVDSQEVMGVKYLCLRICGFMVSFRNPGPKQHELVLSFIKNCNAININLINSIG